MDASIQFLRRWRGIIEDGGRAWLKNYLGIFKSYIFMSVELENLEALDYCIPNIEKSSKEKSSFEFPPHFQSKNPKDIAEIIMVFWK